MQQRMAGWRERVDLPGLGIVSMVAKLDTGARSSALHVLDVHMDGDRVRFVVPLDRDATRTVTAEEELLEWRYVRDSGGHGTLRPVVRLELVCGGERWIEEVTLADRAGMVHRMLLGRAAVRGRFVVDPQRSFVLTAHENAAEAA